MSDGSELYVWQVLETDGRWGIISATLAPDMGQMPLLHRNRDIAARFGPIAQLHAERTELPVRMARFQFSEVIE